MQLKKIVSMLLLQFFTLVPLLFAETAKEYSIKASFVFKFLEFVDWPENSTANSNDLVIAVIGKTPIAAELQKISSNYKTDNRKIKIKMVNHVKELDDANLVFISSSKMSELKAIMDWADSSGALTIGDEPGFAQLGIMINFTIEQESIRFEINKGSAESAGIKISSLLLNVAKIVSGS